MNHVVDGGTYWPCTILHPGSIVFMKIGAEDILLGVKVVEDCRWPLWGEVGIPSRKLFCIL